MFSDSMTLYKLMILYMFRQAKYPLSFSHISEFFVGKEYTDVFTLQQALNGLCESHLIKRDTISSRSDYEITREGDEALVYFGKDISSGIIADIDDYLEKNRLRILKETGSVADYTKTASGDYLVTCEIREGRSILIRLELSAPSEDQAMQMCGNWNSNSQEIYAFAMKQLLKGI